MSEVYSRIVKHSPHRFDQCIESKYVIYHLLSVQLIKVHRRASSRRTDLLELFVEEPLLFTFLTSVTALYVEKSQSHASLITSFNAGLFNLIKLWSSDQIHFKCQWSTGTLKDNK